MPTPTLPSFSHITCENVPNELRCMLDDNLKTINTLLTKHTVFTWDNLMKPLEDMEDALERFWSPVSHLHAVVNSPALRECYETCLPYLSAYETAIGHNQALYAAIQSIDRRTLNAVQCKILDDTLLDFSLAGVALSPEHQHRFEVITAALATLCNRFENNVLDAMHAYQLHITEANRVEGIPEHALHEARLQAEQQGVSGFVFTLTYPCYLAIITHATDRALREEMHRAFATRASDQGPTAGQFDNTKVMNEILALRHEKAQLLGFKHFADLSLATKMASSTDEVLQFLSNLTERARPQAIQEFQQLEAFAQSIYPGLTIAPWDIAYASEQKKQAHHAISEEELRPYFPLQRVMTGLFSIVQTLYGMTFERVNEADVWHPDVLCYRIIDSEQHTRGWVYLDLFARAHKRSGAWMDSCQSRRRLADGLVQLPIAFLTCNFAPAAALQQATLSHDEVVTLFHEFGHCLHHLLTKVDYLDASGIHGVEWDAVELPSQFFENWCWEEEALNRLTAHVDTGEPLPPARIKQLLAAKNFQSAMGMMRQLEFSLFDMRIHQESNLNNPTLINDVLMDVRRATSVVPIAPYNRFQHSFSHIFAGGYAAGYYSYKWAEVLSSDAFARFEEEGIFNPSTGHDFLHCILEAGGSRRAIDAYQTFRGRAPTIDALLRHTGIGLS